MKKYISMLVAIVATLFAVNAFAYTPPPAPANGGYVVDKAGKLSDAQITQLNQKIEQVSKSTKNEFGILLLPDMGGENIEDVANTTYKAWGVGKRGLDNGCLIVVAIKERKSRIETGKGVEGEIPDLKANDILKRNLNPHLKKGDFYGGFDDTLSALSSQMESRHNQKADPAPKADCAVAAVGTNESNNFYPAIFILGGIGLGGWLLVRRARRKAQREANEIRQAEKARLLRLAAQRRLEEALEVRAKKVSTTPVVERALPVTPKVLPLTPPKPTPRPTPKKEKVVAPPAIAASVVVAEAAHQAEQDRLRRERVAQERREEERRAEDRRRRDEEDRRKRQREEDDRRSSSSSSFDWGGSSGGGGFGGGDSGGGGSSSDW